MTTGVQFVGSLPGGATQRWFTFNWAAANHIVWYMMPTSTASATEITWSVAVQRADATHVTYWITVTNQTSATVTFEGRYAILA
jgi:hypothetical protein